jgi:hypothetical protein
LINEPPTSLKETNNQALVFVSFRDGSTCSN